MKIARGLSDILKPFRVLRLYLSLYSLANSVRALFGPLLFKLIWLTAPYPGLDLPPLSVRPLPLPRSKLPPSLEREQ